MYKYIKKNWNSDPELAKQRLMEWRRQSTTVKVERPTRLDRARGLGYKAKQGIIIVRQRVKRGGRMREQITAGRRSKTSRRKKIVNVNYQAVCEVRAQKKFLNMEVLNS